MITKLLKKFLMIYFYLHFIQCNPTNDSNSQTTLFLLWAQKNLRWPFHVLDLFPMHRWEASEHAQPTLKVKTTLNQKLRHAFMLSNWAPKLMKMTNQPSKEEDKHKTWTFHFIQIGYTIRHLGDWILCNVCLSLSSTTCFIVSLEYCIWKWFWIHKWVESVVLKLAHLEMEETLQGVEEFLGEILVFYHPQPNIQKLQPNEIRSLSPPPRAFF